MARVHQRITQSRSGQMRDEIVVAQKNSFGVTRSSRAEKNQTGMLFIILAGKVEWGQWSQAGRGLVDE
jgi:hypothetical protein